MSDKLIILEALNEFNRMASDRYQALMENGGPNFDERRSLLRHHQSLANDAIAALSRLPESARGNYGDLRGTYGYEPPKSCQCAVTRPPCSLCESHNPDGEGEQP